MILKFIIQNLIIIHKGVFLAKIKSCFYIAGLASIPTYVIERIMSWTITNEVYILFVFGAIVVDHILGSMVHLFIKRDFTWKKNLIGVGIKISLAVTMGFLFEGVNHLTSDVSWVKSYLMMVLRLAVFLYPAGSAAMNSAIITKGKFPPIGFITKMKKFNENLDLTQFKGEDNKLNDNSDDNTTDN